MRLIAKWKNTCSHALHSFKDDGIVAHTEVIVGAPNLDFVLGIGGVSNREFASEPVDVVEVAVGLVLVLLGQFALVEGFIVEANVLGLG